MAVGAGAAASHQRGSVSSASRRRRGPHGRRYQGVVCRGPGRCSELTCSRASLRELGYAGCRITAKGRRAWHGKQGKTERAGCGGEHMGRGRDEGAVRGLRGLRMFGEERAFWGGGGQERRLGWESERRTGEPCASVGCVKSVDQDRERRMSRAAGASGKGRQGLRGCEAEPSPPTTTAYLLGRHECCCCEGSTGDGASDDCVVLTV